MKKLFRYLKDRIWNALFLDFYLDPNWTIQFKLMNLISDDALREYFTSICHHLREAEKAEDEKSLRLHMKRAKYWADIGWYLWRNMEQHPFEKGEK